MIETVLIIALVVVALVFALQYRNLNSSLRLERDGRIKAEEELKHSSAQMSVLEQERVRLAERINFLQQQLTQSEAALRHQSARYEADQSAQAERFKLLANEIMEANANRFRSQSESRLSELLLPLRGELDRFRKAVTDCYSSEARERFSLQERIKELIETNQSIGREAKELTSALKTNSKTQGNWGEMILENILEKSGLRRGEEFIVQQSEDDGRTIRNESGRMLRPDVVVNYPDGRVIIIDSKVSLTAYVDYVNSETPELQEEAGKRHLLSVRRHIDELARKDYQDYVGHEKTDFVMMFIPNESAYIAAMTLDNTLWQQAYDKRVLIVSPTHLISALRLIAMLWSHDRQTRNAIEIAEQSGRMYDKFVAFVEEMEKLRKGINNLNAIYESAFSKLTTGTGNLVARAEKLRILGAKTKKQFPKGYNALPSEEGEG